MADLEEGELSECGDEAESLAAWARAAASLQPDGTRLPARRCQVTPPRCAACTDRAGLPPLTCQAGLPVHMRRRRSRAALLARLEQRRQPVCDLVAQAWPVQSCWPL